MTKLKKVVAGILAAAAMATSVVGNECKCI